MTDKIPTTEKLALAMVQAGCGPALIKQAQDGFYDDFKSILEAPIVQLVEDLKAGGHEELAERAMDGEFDAQDWEANAWADSPEGQEALKRI